VRKSLKSKRNSIEFACKKAEIEQLETLSATNYIDLYYYDESHFGLTPSVPYAWQIQGETIEIPSAKGKYVNVAGFFSKKNDFKPYTCETTINAEKLVEIFDDFAQKTVKKTIVIMDNAPIHKSKLFIKNIERWRNENDLFFFFLPTYSPELNLVEIVWRKIKYQWLDFSAFLSFDNLKKNLKSVLDNIGKKFNIQFV
jgi:transposase